MYRNPAGSMGLPASPHSSPAMPVSSEGVFPAITNSMEYRLFRGQTVEKPRRLEIHFVGCKAVNPRIKVRKHPAQKAHDQIAGCQYDTENPGEPP